tara:strand:+ start:4211 stop:4972 length:762 start_codon:yes stop_codon:yes gene_type:complete
MPKWFACEVIGTFIMVFFGLGIVAATITSDATTGIFQIAAVWGLGLTCAIFITAHHSGAHFNPAITLAFAFQAGFPKRRIPAYFVAQLLGAFIAAAAVFFLFESKILQFEELNQITRGEPESVATARMFGEYYSEPVSQLTAFSAEFLGTLLLALVIFAFTAKENKSGPGPMTPVAIGMALTTLICVFAPLTQAGFNPARDIAPRFLSAISGWEDLPFTHNGIGWLTVYVVAPCCGALTGAWIGNFLFSRSEE